MARDEQLLQVVEVGSLAVGSAMIAFPHTVVKLSGLSEEDGAPMFLRSIGMWATGFGALLQYAESEDERDRLLMAGAAIASGSVADGVIQAARKKTTWRAAFTQMVIAGSLAGVACAYLTSD